MTVTEMLDSVQFVVNEQGKRTAVILDIETWQQLLQWATAQEASTATRPEAGTLPPPIGKLEELQADFWPEDESVDAFIAATRQWRQEDAAWHRELP